MLTELKQVRIATPPHTPAQLVVKGEQNWTEEFAVWLQENGRMPKTILAYLQDLRHFSKYYERVNGRSFTPDQLNAIDVKAYFKVQDSDHSIAPNSRNRRLASLRVLVEWAASKGILENDPTICIKRAAVELTPRDRSRDEMQALEAVANSGAHLKRHTEKHVMLGLRDQVIWILFRDAGLRVHELAGLNVSDLDLVAGEIHVMGKGLKKAKVIIPSTLVNILTCWLVRKPFSEEDVLITDWQGKRIQAAQIRRRLTLIGKAAGVDVKPHDLRHTYVYSLLDAMLAQGRHMPVALDAVRKQARHCDVKTTMMYLRSRDSQIRAAVEELVA